MEKVIFSVIESQTVRVVRPAVTRRKMEPRSIFFVVPFDAAIKLVRKGQRRKFGLFQRLFDDENALLTDPGSHIDAGVKIGGRLFVRNERKRHAVNSERFLRRPQWDPVLGASD